jgi:hypothetical protein
VAPYTPSLPNLSRIILSAYDTLKPETAEDAQVNEQLVSHLRQWLASPDRTISDSAVYSINRFIDAELDFKTAGNRGMGRMTDYWPRFGGKYRDILAGTSTEILEKLKLAFCDEVATGYLFAEHLVECMSSHPVPRVSFPNGREGVFEQWVPTIYSANGPRAFDAEFASENEKSYYDVKGLWGHAPGDVVHGHFTAFGIPVDDFAQLLIRQFFDAGVMLRVAEMRRMSEAEHFDIVTAGGYSAAKRAQANNPARNSGCLVFVCALGIITCLTAIYVA